MVQRRWVEVEFLSGVNLDGLELGGWFDGLLLFGWQVGVGGWVCV